MCFEIKSNRKYLTYVASISEQEKHIERGYECILIHPVSPPTSPQTQFPTFTMVKILSKIENQVLCMTTSGVKLLVESDNVVKHSWFPIEGYVKVGSFGYIKI